MPAGESTHALTLAVDAGNEASDLLGIAARTPKKGLRGLVSSLLDPLPPPTRDTIRRTANALDAFAAEVRVVAEKLDDDDLRAAAADTAAWGSALWDGERTAEGVQHDLARLMSDLEAERARRILGGPDREA